MTHDPPPYSTGPPSGRNNELSLRGPIIFDIFLQISQKQTQIFDLTSKHFLCFQHVQVEKSVCIMVFCTLMICEYTLKKKKAMCYLVVEMQSVVLLETYLFFVWPNGHFIFRENPEFYKISLFCQYIYSHF